MLQIIVLAACLQSDEPASPFKARIDLWRPYVRGRMSLDKAFGVDFLEDGAPDGGRFSFEHDGDLVQPSGGSRFRVEYQPESDLVYVLLFSLARWKGGNRLEEPEDVGGGLVLPAGTFVESDLTYWSLEAGVSYPGESPPWFWSGEATLAFYQLKLEADAEGGELDAGTGALGPALGGRVGCVISDGLSLEASGKFLLPLIAGTPRVEAGTNFRYQWEWGAVNAGYVAVFGDEGGDNANRFSMTGPTLGIEFRF